MKIIKKNLKFDMVLDGEKINSLEELREHPSTELLDLQQDGRLSRWVRAHGGANEADQLSALSLTGDKAQDLYAICQILSIDIELEDIKDALHCSENKQDIISEKSTDNIKELTPSDNMKIDKFVYSLYENQSKYLEIIKDKRYEPKYLTTNLDCFKSIKNCTFIQDLICIDNIKHFDNQTSVILLKGDDIGIRTGQVGYEYRENYEYIVIAIGNNIVIESNNNNYYLTYILGENVYLDNIHNNTTIIAKNIFIGNSDYHTDNCFICAKDMLLMGRSWIVPPFSKSKEELISMDLKINAEFRLESLPKNISASTYLYNFNKGKGLDPSLADVCYEKSKKVFLDWIENKEIFSTDFWKQCEFSFQLPDFLTKSVFDGRE